MKHWFSNHGIQALICLVFVGFAGNFLHGSIKYWDVQNWPTVPAQVFGEKGQVTQISGTGRYGAPNSMVIDQRSAEFRYRIGNDVYFGDTVSPNGGGLPVFYPKLHQWVAYYKPGAPEVAVLVPEPFGDTGVVLGMMFTGIFSFVYLWFTIRDFLRKRRMG